jgi:hypothetical protein
MAETNDPVLVLVGDRVVLGLLREDLVLTYHRGEQQVADYVILFGVRRQGARWLGQQCDEIIMDAVPEDFTGSVVESHLQEP